MRGVIITLGMITWNTARVSQEALATLYEEAVRLRQAGYLPDIVVLDNASDDDTRTLLRHESMNYELPTTVLGVGSPVSSSLLRNRIIDLAEESHYVFFQDGDIEIIPGSLLAMAHYMNEHPKLSALAMDPASSTTERAEVDPVVVSEVKRVAVEPLMYLCGYGLFVRAMFHAFRFIEVGPFSRVGWGSEDDDLHFRMLSKGMESRYVLGHTYLHRSPKSSWQWLSKLGVDPLATFEDRRQTLIQEWRRSAVVASRLQLLQAQHVGAV